MVRRLVHAGVALVIAGGVAAGLRTPLAALAANPITSYNVAYLTQSPSYATDHTLWASASASITDSADFVSTDGGSTWTTHAITESGEIVLPSAYPADTTVYEVNSTGLERSDDGGLTFHVVLPYVKDCQALAGYAAGHAKLICIVTSEGTAFAVYDEALGIVTPGPVPPVDTGGLGDLHVAPDGTFFASTNTVQNTLSGVGFPMTTTPEDLLHCGLSYCTDLGTLPGQGYIETMAISPNYSTDHAVAVTLAQEVTFGLSPMDHIVSADIGIGNFEGTASLWVSTDSGHTFNPVTTQDSVEGVVFTGDSSTGVTLVASTAPLDPATPTNDSMTRIDYSSPTSYTTNTNLSSLQSSTNLTWTPDGHLWAASSTQLGVFCSADSGVTWAAHC